MLGLSPQVKVTRCWRKRESKAGPQGVRPLGSRETGSAGSEWGLLLPTPASVPNTQRGRREAAPPTLMDPPGRPGPLSVESRKARYVRS